MTAHLHSRVDGRRKFSVSCSLSILQSLSSMCKFHSSPCTGASDLSINRDHWCTLLSSMTNFDMSNEIWMRVMRLLNLRRSILCHFVTTSRPITYMVVPLLADISVRWGELQQKNSCHFTLVTTPKQWINSWCLNVLNDYWKVSEKLHTWRNCYLTYILTRRRFSAVILAQLKTITSFVDSWAEQ
jgi:hypothetical protein